MRHEHLKASETTIIDVPSELVKAILETLSALQLKFTLQFIIKTTKKRSSLVPLRRHCVLVRKQKLMKQSRDVCLSGARGQLVKQIQRCASLDLGKVCSVKVNVVEETNSVQLMRKTNSL